MRKEYWRPVVGYEGLYEVSNWGRVKRLAGLVMRKNGRRYPVTEKFLTLRPNEKGYIRVDLWKDGEKKTKKVHRLVYEAFVGEIPEGMEVNHMDEDKNNNAVWNLNLLNHKDNLNWGTHNERAAKSKSRPVVARDAERNIIYEFPSAREAGRNGFDQSHIGACCNGKEKTHKGLFWQWA